MANKVLLTTVFTGFNYGSSLQAFAGKVLLKSLGYDCELVAQKSLVKGRDIRLGKLLVILTRSLLLRGKSGSKSLATYQGSYSKELIGDSSTRFAKFTEDYLKPKYLSWNGLKKEAADCIACFAGSDQIWNSSTTYVDPMYYLRFSPAEKRIALAPSFGRDFIADYNQKKMGKWISEFAHVSVREDSGVKLIKEVASKDAIQLVDPTLMIDGDIWRNSLAVEKKKGNYILAYFLDKPSEKALAAIKQIKEKMDCEVIGIPYKFVDMSYCDKIVPTGPIEFLNLINNAICVLTDSFHGTAFSINLHTPFYVFGRAYGSAHSQNSRVESILRKMNMTNRFEPADAFSSMNEVHFQYSENVLAEERLRAKDYIINAIKR